MRVRDQFVQCGCGKQHLASGITAYSVCKCGTKLVDVLLVRTRLR